MKQLAKQPGWQDGLTKLYVKESYEAHAASIAESSNHGSFEPNYQPALRRDQALLIQEAGTDIFLSYRTSQDIEDEEEEDDGGQRDISEGFSDLSQSPLSGGGGPLKNFADSSHFKSFDSVDQESHSSSISNAVDITSSRPDEEGRDYQPLSPFGTSPFDLELGGMGEMGTNTPAGSLTNTPSPLEQCKPFPPLRPRKSSSLSNVLDDTSYGTDPPTGDTISNTSNPQVRLPPQLRFDWFVKLNPYLKVYYLSSFVSLFFVIFPVQIWDWILCLLCYSRPRRRSCATCWRTSSFLCCGAAAGWTVQRMWCGGREDRSFLFSPNWAPPANWFALLMTSNAGEGGRFQMYFPFEHKALIWPLSGKTNWATPAAGPPFV